MTAWAKGVLYYELRLRRNHWFVDDIMTCISSPSTCASKRESNAITKSRWEGHVENQVITMINKVGSCCESGEVRHRIDKVASKKSTHRLSVQSRAIKQRCVETSNVAFLLIRTSVVVSSELTNEIAPFVERVAIVLAWRSTSTTL